MALTSGGGGPTKREERGEGRSQGGVQTERLMGLTSKCERRGDRHLEKRFVLLWACVCPHAPVCECTYVYMCVCVCVEINET